MTYSIVCPYCSHAIKVMDYEEGYQAVVCTACNLPFMNKTTMSPVFRSFALVGVESERTLPTMEEIEEDAKYYAEHPEEFDEISESMKIPLTDETINDVRKWANVLKCVECGKPVSPDSDWRLCEDCLKDDEATDEHLEPRVGYYWPSKKDTLFCALCGEYFDDHGVEDGKCPEKNDKNENQQLPISTNSVFLKCPNAPNSLYRPDGDYVEVKYKKGSVVRTTWSDIHAICEEENPTLTIKELLGERANTNNVAAVNAFVRAVKAGLIEVDK